MPFRCRFPLWSLFLLMTCTAVSFSYRADGTVLPYQETENPLDVAIAGPGFLQVQGSMGEFLYTRDGRLRVNADGQLVVGPQLDELVVQPPITIPRDAVEAFVRRDGLVLVRLPEQPETSIGQIQLATFIAPTGLREVFPGYYEETDKSGANQLDNPQLGSPGILLQGMLNKSDRDAPFSWMSKDFFILILAVVAVALLFAEISRLRVAIGRLEHRIGQVGDS